MASFAIDAPVAVSIDTSFASPLQDDYADDDQFELEDGSRSCRAAAASSFVRKLFDMVERESADIIGWLPDGVSFEVKDPKRLEAEVLPRFFRHSRFQSLVRQLNFYAFKKVSKERSSWVYSHECFQRGRPDLLELLRRKTSRLDGSSGDRKIYSPGAESPYKRARDLDSATGELRTDSFDDTSTESEKVSRKRSSTVTDDILHNWENVIGFFHAKSDYLRPLSAAVPDTSMHAMPELNPNELESISRQLREGGTGDTAVAIILFCLKRNPWKDSRALFYDIFHFLTHNSKLTDEINGYNEALLPSPSYRCSMASLRDPVSYAYQIALLDEHKQLKMRQRYARSLSLGDYEDLDSPPSPQKSPGKRSPDRLGSPLKPDAALCADGVPATLPSDGILRENEATIMRAFMSFAVTNLQTAASVLGDDPMGLTLNTCSATWQNYAQTHS